MPVEVAKITYSQKSIHLLGGIRRPLGREVSVIMSKVYSRFLKEWFACKCLTKTAAAMTAIQTTLKGHSQLFSGDSSLFITDKPR